MYHVCMHDNLRDRNDTVTVEYIGTAVVAQWFGVRSETVLKWLARHNDFPAPDVVVTSHRGRVPGWLPQRKIEITTWHRRRLGQAWRKQTHHEPTG